MSATPDDAIRWAIEELQKLYADDVPAKAKRLETAENVLKNEFRAKPELERIQTEHGTVVRKDGITTRLDQAAVKVFIADELPRFQKKVATLGIKYSPPASARDA